MRVEIETNKIYNVYALMLEEAIIAPRLLTILAIIGYLICRHNFWVIIVCLFLCLIFRSVILILANIPKVVHHICVEDGEFRKTFRLAMEEYKCEDDYYRTLQTLK